MGEIIKFPGITPEPERNPDVEADQFIMPGTLGEKFALLRELENQEIDNDDPTDNVDSLEIEMLLRGMDNPVTNQLRDKIRNRDIPEPPPVEETLRKLRERLAQLNNEE